MQVSLTIKCMIIVLPMKELYMVIEGGRRLITKSMSILYAECLAAEIMFGELRSKRNWQKIKFAINKVE